MDSRHHFVFVPAVTGRECLRKICTSIKRRSRFRWMTRSDLVKCSGQVCVGFRGKECGSRASARASDCTQTSPFSIRAVFFLLRLGSDQCWSG